MSDRINVSTFLITSPTEIPGLIKPAPIRSVRGRVGSNAVKEKVRSALREIGYTIRSIQFGPEGIMAYVTGGPKEPFDSAKSGPGRTRRKQRR